MVKKVFKGILIVFGLTILIPLLMLLVHETGPFMNQVGDFVATYHNQLLIGSLGILFLYFIYYIINN